MTLCQEGDVAMNSREMACGGRCVKYRAATGRSTKLLNELLGDLLGRPLEMAVDLSANLTSSKVEAGLQSELCAEYELLRDLVGC